MAETIVRPGIPAGGRVSPASFPFYTSGEDGLQIACWNSAAGVTLRIIARMLNTAGRAIPAVWDLVASSNRTPTTIEVDLSGLTLLNIAVQVAAGTPLAGQTFARILLTRGKGGASLVTGVILAGFVTSTKVLGWPGSALETSLEAEPTARTIVGSTPAAGADIVETVPTGARWELLTVRANLTLSAGGVATSVRCQIDNGSSVYDEATTPNAGGASTVNPVCFSQGAQPFSIAIGGGTFVTAPFAPNRMLAGSRFSIHSFVGAGAVTWSAPIYNVREWLDI